MIVRPRDWRAVEAAIQGSAPYHYAVIDDFLTDEACHALRTQLLTHWGWRYKTWTSQHLHNNEPELALPLEIGREVLAGCARLLEGLDLVTHWALLYHRDTPGNVHADDAAFSLTAWLTPDAYNLDPATGGLDLYDVKRPAEMMPHEYLVAGSSVPYVAAHTRGARAYVPYRFNRAVLFDARTFHATRTPTFAGDSVMHKRLNLSLAFDDRVAAQTRLAPYTEAFDQWRARQSPAGRPPEPPR